MLGEPLLRRHARIPPDESLVRFLVIAPERTELVRYKLERSPLLRAAIDDGGWHIIKSDHLRTFLAARPARPRRPRAAPRARSGRSSGAASRCRCSAADGRRRAPTDAPLAPSAAVGRDPTRPRAPDRRDRACTRGDST